MPKRRKPNEQNRKVREYGTGPRQNRLRRESQWAALSCPGIKEEAMDASFPQNSRRVL
jgi:hypothetical protein